MQSGCSVLLTAIRKYTKEFNNIQISRCLGFGSDFCALTSLRSLENSFAETKDDWEDSEIEGNTCSILVEKHQEWQDGLSIERAVSCPSPPPGLLGEPCARCHNVPCEQDSTSILSLHHRGLPAPPPWMVGQEGSRAHPA